MQCCACQEARPSEGEEFQSLLVPLRTSLRRAITTVQEAVDRYMPPEEFDNVEQACAHCGGKRFLKQHTVSIAPDVLMICLNRWAHPTEPQLHAVHADQVLEFAGKTYALRSVVSHLGNSPNRGHYVAVSRHDTGHGQWWLYDGSRRRIATAGEIATTARLEPLGQLKSYVLFYEQ